MKTLEINIDGACKGNPGPSGIGVVVREEGKTVRNIHRYIGEATNNIAEYSALIAALEEGLLMGAQAVSIKTDSELLYRQIIGVYKVKNEKIMALYSQARRLIAGFSRFAIAHVPREENSEADKLANVAVAEHRKNGVAGCPGASAL